MRMKNFVVIVFWTFLPLAGRAQVFGSPAESYVKNGVKPFIMGGIAACDYFGKYSGGVKTTVGYSIEFGIEVPFRNKLYGFQPALRLIRKGAKVPWVMEGQADTDVSQFYLEMPLDFTVCFGLTQNGCFKSYGELYISYGVAGTVEHKGSSYDTFGSSGYDFSHFDLGLDVGLSYEYKKFIVRIGVETGFIPVREDDNMGREWPRNRCMYLGVGLYL